MEGKQSVEIRGPKDSIDELERCGLRLDDPENPQMEYLGTGQEFFDHINVHMAYREDSYIIFSLPFEHRPIHCQMEMLLNKYRKCWMKNEYSTDIGLCGIWIGRFQNGIMEIQTHEWQELSTREIKNVTDFSL